VVVSRVNDVGGQTGFGPVPPVEVDEPWFHADWEARVFAFNSVLLRRSVYTLDEFRDAIVLLRTMDARDRAADQGEGWAGGWVSRGLAREVGCSPLRLIPN
jgi:hypothetical protein